MAELTFLVLFPALMGLAASLDLTTMTIPNRLCLAVGALFVVAALLAGLSWTEVAWHVGIGAVVLSATFAMFCAGWIGGGDAKLAAMTALWFGPALVVEYLAVASMLGGGLTLAILHARSLPLPAFAARWPWAEKLHHKQTGIPYGIALAFAALLLLPHSSLFARAFGA
jgi:prepilin peptidase CpaA